MSSSFSFLLDTYDLFGVQLPGLVLLPLFVLAVVVLGEQRKLLLLTTAAAAATAFQHHQEHCQY